MKQGNEAIAALRSELGNACFPDPPRLLTGLENACADFAEGSGDGDRCGPLVADLEFRAPADEPTAPLAF